DYREPGSSRFRPIRNRSRPEKAVEIGSKTAGAILRKHLRRAKHAVQGRRSPPPRGRPKWGSRESHARRSPPALGAPNGWRSAGRQLLWELLKHRAPQFPPFRGVSRRLLHRLRARVSWARAESLRSDRPPRLP